MSRVAASVEISHFKLVVNKVGPQQTNNCPHEATRKEGLSNDLFNILHGKQFTNLGTLMPDGL
jgi:hypothetical protein